MRKLFTLLSAIALVATLGGGAVAASTTGGGGGCFGPGQCRWAGQGADAFWSGVPDSGPVAGVVYTDTYVSASVQSISGGGVKSGGAGLWFDALSYSFDASGNFVPVSDTFAESDGTSLVVTVGKTLRTASASGPVTVVTCVYDATGNGTCTDPAPSTVNIAWTASGALMQTISTNHSKGSGSTLTSTFQGAQRNAVATGAIAGVPISGVFAGADINNARSNTVWICHGTSC